MTSLETLQKYGLKTDVKSIRERVSNDFQHFGIAVEYLRNDETLNKMAFDRKVNILEDELRAADLALLCELAEKGERYERIEERDIPKKVIENEILTKGEEHKRYTCPNCDYFFGYICTTTTEANILRDNYCHHCGQALDWNVKGETK